MQLERLTQGRGTYRDITGAPGRAMGSQKSVNHSLGYGDEREAILKS